MAFNPPTLDDAIYRVKAQPHSQNLLRMGKGTQPSVRSVSFQSPTSTISNESGDHFDERLTKLENNAEEIKGMFL